MKTKGFTLIEILVVMAIIGILAGLTLTAFVGSRKTARDGKRKADLEQIRSALEMCYSDDNRYPPSIAGSVTCVGGKVYLSPTPTDPVSGTYYYNRPTTTSYRLCTRLETGGTDTCSGCSTCNYKVTNP